MKKRDKVFLGNFWLKNEKYLIQVKIIDKKDAVSSTASKPPKEDGGENIKKKCLTPSQYIRVF